MDRRSLTIVGNTTSETKSRFPPIPETPGRGVTYIASGGGGMDFFKEKSMSGNPYQVCLNSIRHTHINNQYTETKEVLIW